MLITHKIALSLNVYDFYGIKIFFNVEKRQKCRYFFGERNLESKFEKRQTMNKFNEKRQTFVNLN